MHILTYILVLGGTVFAVPRRLASHVSTGVVIQRNQECNSTSDSPYTWGLCTNNCQYKPLISGCSRQDWDCIDECYGNCSRHTFCLL